MLVRRVWRTHGQRLVHCTLTRPTVLDMLVLPVLLVCALATRTGPTANDPAGKEPLQG